MCKHVLSDIRLKVELYCISFLNSSVYRMSSSPETEKIAAVLIEKIPFNSNYWRKQGETIGRQKCSKTHFKVGSSVFYTVLDPSLSRYGTRKSVTGTSRESQTRIFK